MILKSDDIVNLTIDFLAGLFNLNAKAVCCPHKKPEYRADSNGTVIDNSADHITAYTCIQTDKKLHTAVI